MIAFARVAPVLPVRRVDLALEHYRKLGFTADVYLENGADPSEQGPIYGFVRRGDVELHLTRTSNLDPSANTSACYLYVADADALFEEWRAAGVEGSLVAPIDTPYGLRELVHVDPDGNLLRVGSELRV
jgi:hypothetical protein